VAPIVVSFRQSSQFDLVYNSISGAVTGALTPAANYGCNETDYVTGTVIALVQRALSNDTVNFCTIQNATAAAVGAGVKAIVFVLAPGTTGRVIHGKSRGTPISTIPLVSVIQPVGAQLLAAAATIQLEVVTNGTVTNIPTSNIVASTRGGATNSVIVVGSHLDSVPAGPGVNDNGSGTSTNLAVALAVARAGLTLTSQVRFCWWGAEEMGLLGSTVRQLHG
jgi:hypothetical protein